MHHLQHKRHCTTTPSTSDINGICFTHGRSKFQYNRCLKADRRPVFSKTALRWSDRLGLLSRCLLTCHLYGRQEWARKQSLTSVGSSEVIQYVCFQKVRFLKTLIFELVNKVEVRVCDRSRSLMQSIQLPPMFTYMAFGGFTSPFQRQPEMRPFPASSVSCHR